MDYKETLLMPNTTFSMRGNLPENEQLMREKWNELDLYNKTLEKGDKTFILHDGPPYANGNIHTGHAFNKILKDFINRYKIMEGYKVIYIPGWDTHGLPIETAVTSSGIDRKSMSKSEFRQHCLKYAKEQVEKQMADFKTLNIIGDWAHPYITFTKEFEAKQIEVFALMAKEGLIFKGKKPVYWSCSSETALAEAEIEYKDRRDPSIYVAFSVVKGNDIIDVNDKLVIWTTTPWTLPGNLAIAVGGDFDYSKVKVGDCHYIIASALVEEVMALFEFENYEIVCTFKGNQLEGITYQHVFSDKKLPVVLSDFVTLDSGTGLVHTAPSYGVDDFMVGQKYNLGMVNGVDDRGILTLESGPFVGLYFEDANKVIVEELDKSKVLLKLKMITHSYPHDWRTKKPIIFRATDQWFCSIEKIKDKLLNEIENNIKFHTPWGKTRIYNMIKDRGDWCISRQRVWGVPIPIFYNEDGSEIIDYDVMMHVSSLFREYGSDIWFTKSAKELLPTGYTNIKSPNGNFTKEEDTMDVWFDSGSSHTAVLLERGLPYPADIYLEGSDQYRGWFNSSLICGVATQGTAPYKELISHGFILDSKGTKMSKSLGNAVDPLKIVREQGSDILRLWASSVDYTEDVQISEELLTQVKESYRKIRNTYRFMLGNLFDFTNQDKVEYKDMPLYDKYMIVKLNEFVNKVKSAYENYNFQEIYKLVNNYVSFNLSNFYLDFTKDILYIESANSLKRRSVQTILYENIEALTKLLAPILPYTSEEVYQLMPDHKESIHLTINPSVKTIDDEDKIINLFDKFFTVKNDIYKALEEARNLKLIGKSLEAKVILTIDDDEFVETFKNHLKQLLIVSSVEIIKGPYHIDVSNFDGQKCERCWNLFDESEMKNNICNRCDCVVKEIG